MDQGSPATATENEWGLHKFLENSICKSKYERSNLVCRFANRADVLNSV